MQLTYLLKILLVYILLICLSIGKYVSNFGCFRAVVASCCSSDPRIFCCKVVYCLANYSNELSGLTYRFKTALNPSSLRSLQKREEALNEVGRHPVHSLLPQANKSLIVLDLMCFSHGHPAPFKLLHRQAVVHAQLECLVQI